MNDTVGTLIAHHYQDPSTFVGVIIGTGSNAAYVEKVDKIPKWKTHYNNLPVNTGKIFGELIISLYSGEMIVNIEWGAFDNEKIVLPCTEYDLTLDRATENPGTQIFEKMISGMYLGEIAR